MSRESYLAKVGVVLLSLSLVSCYVAYQTRVASSQQSLSDLGAVIGGTKSSVLSVDSSYIVEQDKVTSSTQTVFGGTKAASIDFATGDQPSQAPRAAEEPFVDAVLIDKNLHYTLRIPTNDHYAQAFRQYVEALPPAANSGPSSSPSHLRTLAMTDWSVESRKSLIVDLVRRKFVASVYDAVNKTQGLWDSFPMPENHMNYDPVTGRWSPPQNHVLPGSKAPFGMFSPVQQAAPNLPTQQAPNSPGR